MRITGARRVARGAILEGLRAVVSCLLQLCSKAVTPLAGGPYFGRIAKADFFLQSRVYHLR